MILHTVIAMGEVAALVAISALIARMVIDAWPSILKVIEDLHH